MAIIQDSTLAQISVFGAQIPSQGPQVVPVPLDFSASDSYTLDYSSQQQRGRLQLCQTIFIDASQVDVSVSVTFDGSGQTISVPGRTQGYYSVCAANPLKISFSCPGGGAVVSVLLLNYPVAVAQWKSQ
jgi:hypothetical protein